MTLYHLHCGIARGVVKYRVKKELLLQFAEQKNRAGRRHANGNKEGTGMVALKIEEQKNFTEGLFLKELFDSFLVTEANIVTFNSFTINGRVRQGYYSEEEMDEKGIGEFSAWKTIKPFCFSLIKGKRLPESFRIVFALPPESKERFVKRFVPDMAPGQVGGLYLNVHYENDEMTCVTGTSMNLFTMDKTLEREWDESVKQFLKKNGIAFY